MIKDGESLLDLNPSFVGGLGTAKTRMLTSVRKRWAGSGHASVVSGVSADGYVDQLSGGIGFALSHMNYEDGMYEGYTASLSYAPRFELSRDVSLTIGTTVSVNQTRVDFDNYDYDSQVEIEKGTVYDTYSSGYTPRADKSITKDMALGVMLNTPFFFIGGSVDHVFESGQNLYNDDFATSYKVKRKYSVQVGGDYQKHASSEFSISPQLIFTNQAGKSELWVSSAVRCRKLIAGAGFSSSSSLKGIVGLQGKYLRLTYNYDLTKSELSNQLLGSHSASLRVLFFNKKKGSPLAFL
jgi:type IX secretion system PorP/SprF family membrane protein